MREKVFQGTNSITCANSVLPTFMRHSGLLKPASIANERNEIQIVDTHESSETRINTGVSALQHQISRTLLIKSIEQQGQLLVHRARQGFVEQRTATLNRIRGLLSELGIVLPLKAAVVRREALARLEDLPGWANTVIGDLLSEVSRLDERIAQYDQHIKTMARQSTEAQRLMQLSGIGETTATALLSTIGNGRDFKCGRQLCAWLGLVPGQYSSGGKQRLGRITKAGDPYLRSLLVLGARAVLVAAKNKTDPISRWAVSLAQRRGYWKAIVAIAAKNARMCWAVLSKGEDFHLPA